MYDETKHYITVTQRMSGYEAVEVIDGESWTTDNRQYATAEEAREEAMAWAEAKDVQYIP